MQTEIQGKAAQTAIKTQQERRRSEWLLAQLMVLAEARGAQVSAEGFDLYATSLAGFPNEDVRDVILATARAKRDQYEPRWPELGDLLEPLRARQRKRIEARKEAEKKDAQITEFWRWADQWMQDMGSNEAEVLKRFPAFKGTRPR